MKEKKICLSPVRYHFWNCNKTVIVSIDGPHATIHAFYILSQQ